MTTNNLLSRDRHQLHNAAATAHPIDMEVLLSRCMGKASFALALLSELEASGAHHVEAIALHATRNEPQAAAEAAHSLKGVAAIIGAEAVRQIAVEIEAACHADETSLLLDMVHELRGEVDSCLAYIPILRTEIRLC